MGERYYDLLKDKYDIACFADNDPNKQGKKYLSLDIIDPNRIVELGLTVIIALGHEYRLKVVRQLLDLGIKEFFIPESNNSTGLSHIDFRAYPALTQQKNKICVFSNNYSGMLSKSFLTNNPFNDIKVVLINKAKCDREYFYHYLTCSLIITMNYEEVEESKKTIEMGHGFTIKKQHYLSKDKNELDISDGIHKRLMSKNAICSLSEFSTIFWGYCSYIPYEKFHITGYPRNDMLFTSNGRECLESIYGEINKKYIVIYLPTYRINSFTQNGENVFIFDMLDFDIENFDKYLNDHNILFITKMHSAQVRQEAVCENENIRILTDEMLGEHDVDLYEILNGTDCLISDYSSVIIDYLLTDKPMIFTPTDLDAYAETKGIMMEPYDAWMPGEIALNYEQLRQAISNALFGEDKYKKDRERLKRITHKYTDAKSTERVLALAKELMEV